MDIKYLLFFIMVYLLLPACESAPINALTPEVRYMADTMWAKRKRALEEELDSICEAEREEFLVTAIDSFVRINEQKIEQLINN